MTPETYAINDSHEALAADLADIRSQAAEIVIDDLKLLDAKSTLCLSVRNLWVDFLVGLGEFDPDRNSFDVPFSDQKRIKYAAEWPDAAQRVRDAIAAAAALFGELRVESDDQYRQAVELKLRLLSEALNG